MEKCRVKPLVGFHGKEAEQGLGVVGEGSTGAVWWSELPVIL